jgi:hypothetical protein
LINNDINVKIADMVKIQPQRHEGTKKGMHRFQVSGVRPVLIFVLLTPEV